MSVRLEAVGNYKLDYKDHNNIEFGCLSEYILLAKKIIAIKAKWLLSDEDAISSVAYAIMMADWRYDENNNTDTDKPQKTLYSYRNQCAIWAIKTYLTKNRKKIHGSFSLDYQQDSTNKRDTYSLIEDKKAKTPFSYMAEGEEHNNNREFIDRMLQCDELSQKQKDFVKLYYLDGNTYEKIAKKYGLRRESVRQSIIRAIRVLRENYQYEN